jgi:uncharacterized protein
MDRCGPLLARALDAIHTTRLATATSFSISEYSGSFQFFPGRDGAPLPEAEGFTWWDWGNPLERVGIELDPGGVLALIDGDRRFVLGRCPGAIEDHGYTPFFEPEPGDTTSITLDRGVASWPTPFHVTCCGTLGGGGSWYPWARYLYWLREHEAELRQLGVQHLYLFGSTARGEASEDSDVDLFFDYEKGKLGLFELMDVKEQTSRILGRKADIMTRDSLHKVLRARIEASALQVF